MYRIILKTTFRGYQNKIKTSFVGPERAKAWADKTSINSIIYFSWKICGFEPPKKKVFTFVYYNPHACIQPSADLFYQMLIFQIVSLDRSCRHKFLWSPASLNHHNICPLLQQDDLYCCWCQQDSGYR